jgi:hypothetical protein
MCFFAHGFRDGFRGSNGSPAHFVRQAGSLVTGRVLVADATFKRPENIGTSKSSVCSRGRSPGFGNL